MATDLVKMAAKRNLYKAVYTSRRGMQKWVIITIVAFITLAIIVAFVSLTKPDLLSAIKRAFSVYLTP